MPAAIVPVIIGTAGHVHHGKSALVTAFTGCAMNRRPEEKARQLTIDLGFAPCQLADGRTAGVVDVPGHEDFLRNMVAGAASIDVLLLCVAADDGIMPQTREHLRILRVLRAPRLVAALTKCDLADAARREQVAGELRAFLAAEGFPDAPVVACSTRSGEGLDTLWGELDRAVAAAQAAKRPAGQRAFMMAVERSFSAEGHGSVATGIPAAGAVAAGDALEILPAGTATAVRSLQAYRRDATRAEAGTCVALNLRDCGVADLPRGAVLAAPGVYRAAHGLILRLRLIGERPLPRRLAEVRVHAGTAAAVARLRLLDADTLAPGGQALAHLSLAEPLAAAAGDRVLVRLLTPACTLGGGAVAALAEAKPPRADSALHARLHAAADAAEAGDGALAGFLGTADAIVADTEARRLTQAPPAEAAAALRAHAGSGALAALGPGHWLVAARRAEALTRLTDALARWHAAHPREAGAPADAIGAELGLPATAVAALAALCPEAIARGPRWALRSFRPQVEARLAALRERLRAAVVGSGVRPPARGDLCTAWGVAEKDLDAAARLLVDEGVARIEGANVIDRQAWAAWQAAVADHFARQALLALPDFRAATGLSRNLAVAVLERFDAEGITRRQGAGRVAGTRAERSS